MEKQELVSFYLLFAESAEGVFHHFEMKPSVVVFLSFSSGLSLALLRGTGSCKILALEEDVRFTPVVVILLCWRSL